MTNVIRYKGFAARVEFDAEDGIFFGSLAGIEDRISFHADNVKELTEAFHHAVDDYIEACAKVGKTPEKPYSGNLFLRVDPALHANVALAAKLSGKSVNQWSEEVLQAATR